MFTRSIAVFVAVVVLVTGSPAMAQSSDLLASAERAALTMQVEQDQSVVRRRRSGGLGASGVVMAGVGIFLALRPPVCELVGEASHRSVGAFGTATETFTAALKDGKCGVRLVVDGTRYDGAPISSEGHSLDANAHLFDFRGRRADTNKTMNWVGWTTAAAGGALMWFGLRAVDVPVRFDMASTGGFRVSRSLGW